LIGEGELQGRTLTTGASRDDVSGAQLKAGALTLRDSTVMAVASTAPAYSLAATMAAMVAVVGLASPAAILVSFLPVLGIAIAYFYMNSTNPNCGASYTWLTQSISPWLGWFTGWVQTAASLLFMVQAPALAGANTLSFLNAIGWIDAATVNNPWVVALAGIAWLAVVTAMVIYGVQLAARFQWLLLSIEYAVVIGFAILAFNKVLSLHPKGSQAFSWNWLNPFAIHDIGALANGAVLAVFFFWGWDAAANVNEETKDARFAPGQAGIIGMFLLLFIFLFASSAMQALVPQDTIVNQGSNAMQYFARQIVPALWSDLMLLAVLSSTVATVQTTLLPAARVTLSMARDGVWPRAFLRIHPRFKTPWVGTLILALIATIGLLLTLFSPDQSTILADLVGGIGVLVGFYYGITGLACAWYFRRLLRRDMVTLIFAGIVPFVSGLLLFAVGTGAVVTGEQQSGWISVLPCLIALALGIPFTLLAWWRNKAYFAYRPTAYDGLVTSDE